MLFLIIKGWEGRADTSRNYVVILELFSFSDFGGGGVHVRTHNPAQMKQLCTIMYSRFSNTFCLFTNLTYISS